MMMDLLADARTVSCIALAVRIMIVEMHTLSIRYALARRIHNIMFCTLFQPLCDPFHLASQALVFAAGCDRALQYACRIYRL